MKVVELLRKVGSKAGLIQIEEASQTIEVTVWQKQVVSLQQLQEEAEKNELEALAAPPPEITIDFAHLFEALKIEKPAHGWTVEKLKEALGDSLSKNRQEAAAAASTILKSNQVPPEDIIKDAVNRDKALDSYEVFVAKKMEDRSASRKQIMEELRQQIRESEAQIEKLNISQDNDEKNFAEWQSRKMQQEEDLARVVSLLTSEPEITVGKAKKKI